MNDIIELQNINELPENIKKQLERHNLNIFFNYDSELCVMNFLSLNLEIKEYYIDTNSKIFIDLLEKNTELYFFLINCINDSFNIINNCNLEKKIFGNNYEWIISICDNIMFDLPFTLEKTIFIPYNYLNKCFANKNNNKLITTLIHEKIHTSQRTNEFFWENYIQQQDSNWIKIKSNDVLNTIIINSIMNQHNLFDTNKYTFISNPDTFYGEFKYVYKINNEHYYGQFIYDKQKQSLTQKYYLIDVLNHKLIDTDFKLKEEHPYETYAYEISEKII